MTMEPKIIDVHAGSTSESWLTVYPDGRIEYHQENDGLYEASRVKKFFEINIFSFPAVQEASRRVSAVLR